MNTPDELKRFSDPGPGPEEGGEAEDAGGDDAGEGDAGANDIVD